MTSTARRHVARSSRHAGRAWNARHAWRARFALSVALTFALVHLGACGSAITPSGGGGGGGGTIQLNDLDDPAVTNAVP